MTELKYEEAKALIKREYVDKVFGFLRGELTYVTKSKDFVKVHEVVMHQCDAQDNAGKLYQYFQEIIRDYLKNEALIYIKRHQEQGNIITAFIKQWDNFAMLSKLMDRMFDYLNRYYLKNQSLKLLGQTAMDFFKKELYEAIKVPLLSQVLQTFTDDRNGNLADKQKLERVIKCYVQMGLVNSQPQKGEPYFFWDGTKNLQFYEEEFETPFLKRSKEEYDQKARNWISNMTAPEYLRICDNHFTLEEGYCDTLLQSETRAKLMKRVEEEIITKRNTQIVEKDTGCKYMIENSRRDELKLMYKCFVREESNLTALIHILNAFIEDNGKKIIEDENNKADEILYTQKLLDFKKDIDELIAYAFNNNIKFEKGRDTSFQNFMNLSTNTPSYIAKYTDKELTAGLRGVSNAEVDQRLSSIVRLFCCLHGRDMFLKAYQGHLSARLLNQTMISNEAEELMLSKLKMELGINAVNKMTQMFKDIQLSKDMFKNFSENPNNQTPGIELESIEILTNGNWPIEEQPACVIPRPLKLVSIKFEKYYQSKYNNRKLMWLNQYGTVEMTPTFTPGKRYILRLTVFQSAVLSLFNEKDSWTYGEIAEKTQVPKKRLDNNLLMLCKPAVKLLVKQEQKPTFENNNETIALNLKWANPSLLVKLMPTGVAAKKKPGEEAVEQSQAADALNKERGFVIDGAIVKVMKTNKDTAVKHTDLVNKVAEMIALFKAQPPQIKTRIEDLINKQYMRRDEKDRAKYWYIA